MPSGNLRCRFCLGKKLFKSQKALNAHFPYCPGYQEVGKRQRNHPSPQGSPKRALGPLPPEQRKRGRFDEQETQGHDCGEGPSYPQQSGQSAKDLESSQLNPPPGEGELPTSAAPFSSYAGVPKALWLGREEELHLMVLEPRGPSLEERFNTCGRRFSLITVALIAGQLLTHLQNIHTRHYIHRDIKPANILTGLGDTAHIVCLANFRIAKRFRNPNTHAHVPLSNGQHLVGCVSFASINSHLGIELSRRDDLESLAYVLVYLLRGSLPWISAKSPDVALHLKQHTTADELCSGLPKCFKSILEYSRALSFTAKPDYTLLHSYVQDMRATLPDTDETCDWQRPPLAPVASLEVTSIATKLKTRRRKPTKVVTPGEAMPQRVLRPRDANGRVARK